LQVKAAALRDFVRLNNRSCGHNAKNCRWNEFPIRKLWWLSVKLYNGAQIKGLDSTMFYVIACVEKKTGTSRPEAGKHPPIYNCKPSGDDYGRLRPASCTWPSLVPKASVYVASYRAGNGRQRNASNTNHHECLRAPHGNWIVTNKSR